MNFELMNCAQYDLNTASFTISVGLHDNAVLSIVYVGLRISKNTSNIRLYSVDLFSVRYANKQRLLL